MSNETLKNIIKQVESLPTLPTTYARINDLIRKPTTNAVDIADVISKDQVLTARLLKLVNSAFYGFSGKIKTVSGAVVVLGFKSIKHLVLSSSVLDLFNEKENNPFLDPIDFWRHSLSVAVGCKILSKYIDAEDPEEFFVAGLLHDIGKLILNQYLRASFIKALEFASLKTIPIFEAEQKQLEFTHSEIGLLLAQKWKLPECILEAISYHHEPNKSEKFQIFPSIVHVANIFVKALELGNSGDNVVPKLSNDTWESLHISIASIEPIMNKLKKDSFEVCQILNPIKQENENKK